MVRSLSSTMLSLALCAVAAAQDGSPADAAPKGPPPTPVRVAAVREESLAPRKKVFGELRAARRVTVATEEGGIVREVPVREGEAVAAGAVVARLDDARLKLEIAANAANLGVARATVGERESQLARAQRDLDLVNRAAAQGGTNPREIADNESAVAVAKAQLVQANAAITVVEQQGAYLAKRLADLEIRAPFAGVVTARHAEQGGWIAAGGMVVDLVDTVNLEGWFDVPQELYGAAIELSAQADKKLTRALPVDIETATGNAINAVGIRVVPEIDPRSRTFHAVLRIGREDRVALASGIALTAYVPAGAQTPRLLVPKDAILRGESGPFVYAVRDGIAVPVNVRIVFPSGADVAIEPGALAAGAKVVVEGNERLMPMSPVAPLAAGTEGKQ
jgi:RND family efflux transporter MFP subunit